MTDQIDQFSPKSYSPQNAGSNSGMNWRVEELPGEVARNTDEIDYKLHPKECEFPLLTKHFTVMINTAIELAFLTELALEIPFDYKRFGLSVPRQLMTVLNQYGIGDGWSCNPRRGNSVAEFKLLYLGKGSEVPAPYRMNTKSPLVAIVEVDTFDGKEVLSLAVR